MLRFRFELRPVLDIEPWGRARERWLSWFGLTDGWQCLDTAAGRLLEYARPEGGGGSRWAGYQVVRLFEDLLGIWPWVRDPVPEDVTARFLGRDRGVEAAHLAGTSDPGAQERWRDALACWQQKRRLGLDHFTLAPELFFWRTGAAFNLVWEATGRDAAGARWAVQHARLSLPFEQARRAVEDFSRELLAAMAERVGRIAREGWGRSDCRLDVAGLVAEQREREEWASSRLAGTAETDWDEVRRLQDAAGMGCRPGMAGAVRGASGMRPAGGA